LTFEQHSLQSLMDEAVAESLDRITLQQINMQIRYASTPCFIMANKEKLRIAFLNIIINAVEAMEPGKGLLSITVESSKNLQVVVIRDNGCGIPAENISRLFEPYFTGKMKGNGLGLTNTQNIILNHKGSITVKSKPGQGSTFIVTLLQHLDGENA
ncbi:MAG: GHKL domain-containing protein, partial [Pedobacter sp.]